MSNSRIESLLKALPSRENDPFVYYAVGIEYRNAGDDEQALHYLELVHTRFPEYVPNYYHLAAQLEKAENYDRALEIYAEGLRRAQAAGDTHAYSELTRARTALQDLIG
jgi:tetratricopeptide (TPR) repeat protein